MQRFCLFCKTFRRDLDRFGLLLESVERHNRSGLPFIVSVPAADRPLFEGRFGGAGIELITDEEIQGGPLRPGWKQQQVVKLAFWKLRRAEAYLVLDADFYFIRDFSEEDFFDAGGHAFFVVSPRVHCYRPGNTALFRWIAGEGEERHDLARLGGARRVPAPVPLLRRWADRLRLGSRSADRRRMRIAALFGREGPDYQFMPGPILHHAAQERFHERYLAPQGLGYDELIQYSPWESHWYGEWMLAMEQEVYTGREPFFLHFASDEDVQSARGAGLTLEDFSRRYLGLALAAGHQTILSY